MLTLGELGSALPVALATAVPVLAGLQPADAAHPHPRSSGDFSVQGWTTRTSALLPVHRDDPLDTMVHSAPYVQTSSSRCAGKRMMIECTVKMARCALDILYTYCD